MRRRKQQPPLLLRLLLLLLACDVVLSSFICPPNNKIGKCICTRHHKADYEVHCPHLNSRFDFLLDVGVQARLTCQTGVTYQTILDYLDGISIGEISGLKIQNCPVPEESLADFVQLRLGVPLKQGGGGGSGGGLVSLAFTNAAGSVKPFHLQNLTGLVSLDLDRSLIGARLDKTYFQDMTNLKWLILNANRGLELAEDTFSGLPSLQRLGLSGCSLNELHVDLFAGLANLTELNLYKNRLTDLPSGIFRDLRNLSSLGLQNNRLTGLPQGIFDSLVSLETIDIGFNHFQSLPENLFLKTTSLQKLFFVFNNGGCRGDPQNCRRIALPNTFFQIPSLTFIKVLHVPIHGLHPEVLKGAKSLVNVTIQSTHFGELHPGMFKDCASLERLDLAGNGISELPEGVFTGLSKLVSLELHINAITTISQNVLSPLRNLELIKLHSNNISQVDKFSFSFLKNLVEINMSRNNLVYPLPGQSSAPPWFLSSHTFQRVERLDLSQNKFRVIEQNIKNTFLKLKMLNMSGNSITELHMREMIFSSSESGPITVDLSRNNIKRIILKEDQVNDHLFGDMKKPRISLKLEGNPLICDCFITELRQKMEGRLDSAYNNLFVLDNNDVIRCGADSAPGLAGHKLEDVDYNSLVCKFPSKVLEKECPAPCSCSWNRHDSTIRIDCENKSLTSFPRFLPTIQPTDTLHLNLDNNRIVNLTLAVDHFNNNNNNNNQSNYAKISGLSLSSNRIQELNQQCLPPNLKLLKIDGNELTHLDKSSINFFSTLVDHTDLKLRLGNNPYSCNCDSKDLFHFINSHDQRNVIDRENVYLACKADKRVLSHSSLRDGHITNLSDFCLSFPPEIIAIIVLIVLVLGSFVLVLLFYSCYKDTIQIWVYSQGWLRFLFTDELLDSDKLYDVFISYANTDSDFVNEVLLPGLENSEESNIKYKCLIHEKDWLVGENIPDNILNSVQSSRRTLIVLSKDFIKSMWSTMEFQAAHNQALKDKTQRVVIVVRGELPSQHEMEEDLRRYISLNTYIHEDNPWFWQRLRYALPHRGRRPTRRKRTRRETDQLELMRAQAEAEMGKGSRTPSPPQPASQPSPPTVSMLVASDTPKNKNGFVNGGSGHGANGGAIYGRTALEPTTAASNGRLSKEELTEDYLRRVVPQHASREGQLVRDIMMQHQAV